MSVQISLGVPEVKQLITDNEEVRLSITKGAISILIEGLAKQVRNSFLGHCSDLVRIEINKLISEKGVSSSYDYKTELRDSFKEQVRNQAVQAVEAELSKIRQQAEATARIKIEQMQDQIDSIVERRINVVLKEEVNKRVAERLNEVLAIAAKTS